VTAAWVVAWIAAGFMLGVLYVLVLQAIFTSVDDRRGHRRILEHEARMTRYAAEASPRVLP
jgi:hypothetical protein